MTMRRLAAIWYAAWRYSLSRELMFRGNFLLWMLVEVCWFALQIAFIEVLYLHVDSIAGWTKWEMVLLVGVSQLIQQLFQTFFLVNFINFPELVRSGKLDFYLLQPAPVLFLATTRLWDVGSVFNSLFALGVSLYAAARIPVHPDLPALLSCGGLVLVGIGVHYALLLALVTPAFWMTRAQGFIGAYYQSSQLARQPREAFRGVLRFAFSWVFPLLLVANLPSRALFGGLHGGEAAWLVGVTAALLAGAVGFFHYGLRHYTSASS